MCSYCEGWGCTRCTKKPPYHPSRELDAPSAEELELERLRAEVKRLAAAVCCPSCGTEVERSAQ